MKMNVLKYYPMTKKYYFKHPLEIISQTFSNLYAAWERITKGFSTRDTWDLDQYLLNFLPNIIECLKNNKEGYPNNFNSLEEWENYLSDNIITPLKNARQDQTVMINEFEDKTSIGDFNKDGTNNEFWRKFVKRENEIFEWQDNQLKLGLRNLGEHFWALWD